MLKVAERQPGFTEQALANADALYNFARWLAGDRGEAEDLVQETYLRAMAAAPRFEPGTNLKAWLFRILRNTFIDQRRKRQHDPSELGVHLEETFSGNGNGLAGDLGLDQLRALEAHEVAEAVHDLPEQHRTVILLDLEGMTEVEVAEVLGCAVGTVKSRLARARAELRVRLKEYRR